MQFLSQMTLSPQGWRLLGPETLRLFSSQQHLRQREVNQESETVLVLRARWRRRLHHLLPQALRALIRQSLIK